MDGYGSLYDLREVAVPTYQHPNVAGEENDYFDTLYEWTYRKHDILRKYVETFAKIKKNLYCVDAFAGRGQHRDGAHGSPLITASIAQRLRDEGKPYWLRCLNVEKDSQYYADLCEATAAFATDLVHNFRGDFAGHMTRLLAICDKQPALFFLDPFGVDGIEWKRLQPILTRTATTELLINFNVRYIPRLAGHVTSNAAAAHAKVRLLSEVLGTTTWIPQVISPGVSVENSLADERVTTALSTDATLGDRLTDIYKQQLCLHFPYVYHYPIRAAADGHVRYYLIFATRSEKGVSVMNDILCATEEQYQEDVERLHPSAPPPAAAQLSLFAAESAVSAASMTPAEAPVQCQNSALSRDEILLARQGHLKTAIQAAVQQAFQNHPHTPLTYLQLRCQLARQWFAQVKRSTYSQPLQELYRGGVLTWDTAGKRLPKDDELVYWAPPK